MDQHGDHAVAAQVARAPLLGARAPLDDRVDRLEVRGVRREREVHALPRVHHAVVRVALVVLDVARAEGAVDQRVVLELGEDRVERLAQRCSRARSGARGAPCRSRSRGCRARGASSTIVSSSGISDSAPSSEKRFCPTNLVWRKRSKSSAAETFSRMRRRSTVVSGVRVRGILEPPLQPALAARILDVGELDADLAAIGGAQPLEDLAQRLHRPARKIAGDVGPIEIVAAEAVVGRIELGEVERLPAERVGVGDAVSARAVGVDQPQHARVLVGELRLSISPRWAAAWRGSRRAAAGPATSPPRASRRIRPSSRGPSWDRPRSAGGSPRRARRSRRSRRPCRRRRARRRLRARGRSAPAGLRRPARVRGPRPSVIGRRSFEGRSSLSLRSICGSRAPDRVRPGFIGSRVPNDNAGLQGSPSQAADGARNFTGISHAARPSPDARVLRSTQPGGGPRSGRRAPRAPARRRHPARRAHRRGRGLHRGRKRSRPRTRIAGRRRAIARCSARRGACTPT